MNPPNWGIVLILVVGTIVVAAGWWSDRRRHRRAVEAALRPPERDIPGFRPVGEPVYLTEDALAATRPFDADPTPEDLALLGRRDDAATIPAGASDGRFLNFPRKGLALWRDPSVLVTPCVVDDQRVLLTVLDAAARLGRPLVWVAHEFSPEVLATLRVNLLARTALSLPIELADAGHLRTVTARTGASVVPPADLHSGYLPEPVWGTCAGWVSDLDDSWIVPPLPTIAR